MTLMWALSPRTAKNSTTACWHSQPPRSSLRQQAGHRTSEWRCRDVVDGHCLVRRSGLEYPVFVQKKVPSGRQDRRDDFSYLVTGTQPVNKIDDDVHGNSIKGHQEAILYKAHAFAVFGAKRENTLKGVIEGEADEESDRSGYQQIHQEYFMQQHEQTEINHKGYAANNDETRQLAV